MSQAQAQAQFRESRRSTSAAQQSAGLAAIAPAFFRDRPKATAQPTFARTIENSPHVLQRKILFDNIRTSPRAMQPKTLADQIAYSPRVLQQRAFFERAGNSPRIPTQRRRMEGIFGGLLRRSEKEQSEGASETLPHQASQNVPQAQSQVTQAMQRKDGAADDAYPGVVTESPGQESAASALSVVAQLKRGKKSRHNRKNKRLAKQMGFHPSEFGEGVSVRDIVRADEERREVDDVDEQELDDVDEEEMGPATDHLARLVLPGNKKVALIGENHAETSQWEGSYFGARGLKYHSEISSLQQTYTESEGGELTVEHKADNFAIENVPLRALSEVLDLIEYGPDFAKTYIVPVNGFWADCLKIVTKMDKLVNPRMLGKLAKKLHLTKIHFVAVTVSEIIENNSLYLEPLHSLFSEMPATSEALKGTTAGDGAAQLAVSLVTAKGDFDKGREVEDPEVVMNLEETEDFEGFLKNIDALEAFHEQMGELLPEMKRFLSGVVARQSSANLQLPGTGTDTHAQITTGRSEAMLNNAVWLSENTANTGEVVKVGEAHIDDMDAVDVAAEKLNIIHKDDYYKMQDDTNTRFRN